MADPHRGHRGFRSTDTSPEAPVPAVFTEAVAALSTLAPRPEFELETLPGPRRLAAHSHAVSASVYDEDGEEIASGRFVLLFEPDGPEEWRGVFRCVTFAQAELEAEITEDPLLPEVVWSWLTEALDTFDAAYDALGGTVSRSASDSFGELAQRPVSTCVELRASWTPVDETDEWSPSAAHAAVAAHFAAWLDLLASAAGLPPLVAGVTALPKSSR